MQRSWRRRMDSSHYIGAPVASKSGIAEFANVPASADAGVLLDEIVKRGKRTRMVHPVVKNGSGRKSPLTSRTLRSHQASLLKHAMVKEGVHHQRDREYAEARGSVGVSQHCCIR